MQFLKTIFDLFCEITALISAFQRIIETLRELNDDMKVSGFKCDQCEKLYNQSISRGVLPPDWFSLVKGNSIIGAALVGNTEKHFCSIECLINWTSLQTVDSRKIEDSDFFGIEGEMSDVIIAYMKEKGWNAEFKTMKDLDGRRWKQFQAVKDDGCKIRIDAIFFKGMTSQQIFECIDSYVDKCARS